MPTAARSQPFTATDATLMLMTTIWAVNFSVTKYASSAFEPRAFTGLRVFAAAAVLLLISVVARVPVPRGRALLVLLAIGVVGHAMYQLLFIEGLARTRAGNAALIIAASPALIAVVSRWRGIDHLSRRTVTGLALSTLGVIAVVLGAARADTTDATLLGNILVLAGVVCWTTFTIVVQPFTLTTHPLTIATTTIVGGVVPLLVFTGPALARTAWNAIPAEIWPAVFYSSVVSMVIAYLFWFRGVRILGPTRTAVYANVQPVIAVLVAWATLGEVPTIWQALGTVTIVSGLFFTRS